MQNDRSANTARQHIMLNIWVALTILIVASITLWELWGTHNAMEKSAFVATQNLAKTLELSVSGIIGTIDIALANSAEALGIEQK